MNPVGPLVERSGSSAHTDRAGDGGRDLWGEVFSRENLFAALGRVERNRGAPGVDGLKTSELRSWLVDNWTRVRGLLDAGTYKPFPVRRVVIPKPGGGKRFLGVPAVLDRMIQQAIVQVLSPIFDAGFVPVSYGFRPGKSAHQAIRAARVAVEQGYRWVVEVDLDSFFDRVNHDALMSRVARKVKDKKILKLIRAYLNAGIMAGGVKQQTRQGVPQGSPLSPLLSNIMLDDFDQLMWKRGVRHVRYADDIRVFVKSKRAAERVFTNCVKTLEDTLKLKVNQQKSRISHANVATLLGYGFYFTKEGVKLRVAPNALQQAKRRIRRLTSRRWSISMVSRVRRLNRYLQGWMAYFRLARTPGVFKRLDEWYRRRLRMIRWKEWKRPRTKVRALRSLGVPPDKAWQWGMSSRAYWRSAGSPILQRALPNQYWEDLGVLFFTALWRRYQPQSKPPYA